MVSKYSEPGAQELTNIFMLAAGCILTYYLGPQGKVTGEDIKHHKIEIPSLFYALLDERVTLRRKY